MHKTGNVVPHNKKTLMTFSSNQVSTYLPRTSERDMQPLMERLFQPLCYGKVFDQKI